VDVTEATFNEDVIERSAELPVVVDFWAEWCAPCRQLAPLIEAAVERRPGELVLAKVNIDENPGLARAYRVSSIPAVKAFRDGKVADEFVGLLPPPQIEAFINRVLPSQADLLVEIGDEASLREALVRDAGHLGARIALGKLLVADGREDEAVEVLRPASFDPVAEGLVAQIGLRGLDHPDVQAGFAALDRGDLDAALGHLVDAAAALPAQRDELRKAIVAVFAELGDQHPLTIRHRKRLARVLY
jgi:putative thioredoxin